MELSEMNRFRHAARRLFRANLKSVSVQAISSPLMDAIGAVGIALLLLLGHDRMVQGTMSLGDFTSLFIITSSASSIPCANLRSTYNSFQQALGASGRDVLFRFMDAQGSMYAKRSAPLLTPSRIPSQFENVGFACESDGEIKPVLNGIDLDVKRGEVPSRLWDRAEDGKSTLLNLIPRFFDVTGGRILIDALKPSPVCARTDRQRNPGDRCSATKL